MAHSPKFLVLYILSNIPMILAIFLGFRNFLFLFKLSAWAVATLQGSQIVALHSQILCILKDIFNKNLQNFCALVFHKISKPSSHSQNPFSENGMSSLPCTAMAHTHKFSVLSVAIATFSGAESLENWHPKDRIHFLKKGTSSLPCAAMAHTHKLQQGGIWHMTCLILPYNIDRPSTILLETKWRTSVCMS